MYDVTVENQKYYSNNILSHNTTSLSPYALWYACFNRDKFIGITSNKGSSAKDFLRRIKTAYEELPVWMKPGVIEYNKFSIQFDNGSMIETTTTTEDSFTGRSINLLMMDELAKVRPNIADAFWSSVYPTISASKDAKIIIISTAKGVFNLYHNLWTGAVNGTNNFKPFRIYWNEHPERDLEWLEEQKLNLGERKFRQEVECEFLGSDLTLLNKKSLDELQTKIRNPLKKMMDGKFEIFEEPIPNVTYVAGVDVGEGISQDASVIQIFKLLSLHPVKMRQVAVYCDNTISTHDFPEIINTICTKYNKAKLLVENNSIGDGVVNKLWWDLQYENLYNYGRKRSTLGVRATKASKFKAISIMKKLIENGNMKVFHKDTINQLSDFTKKGDSYSCGSLHDDLVTGVYWASFIFETDEIDEYDFTEVKTDEEKPLGIFTDKIENEDWGWLMS